LSELISTGRSTVLILFFSEDSLPEHLSRIVSAMIQKSAECREWEHRDQSIPIVRAWAGSNTSLALLTKWGY